MKKEDYTIYSWYLYSSQLRKSYIYTNKIISRKSEVYLKIYTVEEKLEFD